MTDSAPDNKESLVLDLNFTPGWARKPPEAGAVSGGGESSRDRAGDYPRRDRQERSERRPGGGGGRDMRPRSRDRGRPDSRPASGSARPMEPVEKPLEGLDISFLPERRGLAPLAHRLAKSARAYSLFEVAALFLSKPDYYLIKVEAPAAAGVVFFQCAECKAVFLDREAAATHVFSKHFDQYCRKEEREVEPPKGNFVCIAKCGLSGLLLGPPNYHGYNDKVAEIHRLRYPDMPLEAYRRRIDTIHDTAAIETWKEEMRKQPAYCFGEGEKAVSFSRFSEAEAWFREHRLPGTVKEMRSVIIPGPLAYAMDPGPLRRAIEEAWQTESRFPLKLSVTLRLAFRHLGLHTFKAAGGHTFVTAVVPSAIDPAHAVEGVRELLDCISTNPGCTRAEVWAKLVPPPPTGDGEPAASAAATPTGGDAPPAAAMTPRESELRRQLQWLVEKGHVIEFSDGRMAVPATAVARVQVACHEGRNRRAR